MSKRLAIVLLSLGAARMGVPADKPLFIELAPEALPADMGASGFVVVGGTYGGEGFYWMPTSGVVRIGGLRAAATSADGRTIIGEALDPNGEENAAIWLGGTDWRLLGSFRPDALACDQLVSSAYGTSDDAKVIVGLGWDGCKIAHAFRWEESTGMVDLGSTVSGRGSRANAISGDGKVVVGFQEDSFGFRQGAKWVNGAQEVISGPNGIVGEADATNHDGSVIVGTNCSAGEQAAWMWRSGSGVTCYPPPRQGPVRFQVLMLATSDDGRVVGGAQSFGLDSASILWIDGEPHYLKDYLREKGVSDAFDGWVNTGYVNSVSRDGRVIAGYGAGPKTFQGFVVILESP